MRISIIIFLLLITVHGYAQDTFKYNLGSPDLQHQLPEILNEISGLTDIDSAHVACVQDELGIVFIYNFRTGKIISQHDFDKTGDFEGLTYTKKDLFILRSDGRLTEWNQFPSGKTSIKHYNLPLVTANNEGLCFDPHYNRILIAAKSKPQNHDAKSERYIYSYDLKTKRLLEEPVYSLNVDHLTIKLKELGNQRTASIKGGSAKRFNFRPASLAVHPITDEIYIISAIDKLLLVMNRQEEILQMESLDPALFAKAEGITFLDDGTMIITNEAAGKTPNLYVFNMKK